MFVSETRRWVARLLDDGLSPKAVADRLRLAETTVSYHIERLRAEAACESPRLVVSVGSVRFQLRTRERVAELLSEGNSRAETARRLGLSKATVSYHARRLGMPIDERAARRYDWEAIQRYYDEGHSVRQCREAFGFAHQTWQSAKSRGDISTRPQSTPDDELFAAGRPRSRANLKRRLLADQLKADRCAVCEISKWHGRTLSLALHHINGDRLDNRLENLELLCPNCHSQTDTYSGRNGHRRAGRNGASPAAPGREAA